MRPTNRNMAAKPLQAKSADAPIMEDAKIDWLKTTYGEKLLKKAVEVYDYKKDTPVDEVLDKIISADPTYKPGHAGKYAEWLIKQFLATNHDRWFEDAFRVKDHLGVFDRLKGHLAQDKRDINKLDTFTLAEASAEIRAIIAKKKGSEDFAKTSAERVKDANVEYQDDGVTVYRPLTYGASFELGGGGKSEWCTSYAGESGQSHWANYNSRGCYLLIFKFKNKALFQLQISGNGNTQLMDKADRPVDLMVMLDNYQGTHETEFYQWLGTLVNVRYKAAASRENPKYAEKAAKMVAADILKEPDEIRRALARAVNLSTAELDALLKTGDSGTLRILVQKQLLPKSEVEKLIKSEDRGLAVLAAMNQQLERDKFEDIFKNGTHSMKMMTARNPNLPPDLMSKIIHYPDPNGMIKLGLALNPSKNIPDEVRQILMKDRITKAYVEEQDKKGRV